MAAGPIDQAPAAAPTTVQQDFEAAVALSAQTDKQAQALAAWQALEHRVAAKPRNLAIVRLREGEVLFNLQRDDDAARTFRLALASLPTTDPSLVEDRYSGLTKLGSIALAAIDYSSAVEYYQTAYAIAPDDVRRLGALRGKMMANTFVDPQAAMADVATMHRLMESANIDKTSRGAMLTAEAELYLNLGMLEQARKTANAAVSSLGGLTTRVDLNDIAARADEALADLLLGKSDDARELLAYTGAGLLEEGNVSPAVAMEVPQCDVEGLRPEDVAVVEFSIEDDGMVRFVRPIYAAGGPQAGLSFARVARDWSFSPELVKKMKPFFRHKARVELRCSRAFPRPGVAELLETQLVKWLSEKSGADLPDSQGSLQQRLASDRQALDVLKKQGATGATLALALHRVAVNPLVPREESNDLSTQVVAALPGDTPPLARLAAELRVWQSAKTGGKLGSRFFDDNAARLSGPEFREDAQARAALVLILADAAPRSRNQQVAAMLDNVVADRALSENDAFRKGAFIRLASLQAVKGNDKEAAAAFEKSGLTANQCALADSAPRLVSAGGIFPEEAKRWGFEGWAQTEFDITAEGRVINPRVTVAYPPFVFSKATLNTIAGSRYAKTYRPEGELGCGSDRQRVRFTMGS